MNSDFIKDRSKGYEMWLRVANLALFTIPTISLIEYDNQSVILRFSHVKNC